MSEDFQNARAQNLGDDDLQNLAKAAAMSRIRTLLVDESMHRSGQIDMATGEVTTSDEASSDVLDDLAELVLRRGGEVVVMPAEHMPTKTGLAGSYRY